MTHFGLFMPFNERTIEEKIARAKQCNKELIRYAIHHDKWDKSIGDKSLQKWIDADFKICLNVVWESEKLVPFCHDIKAYKNFVNEVLDKYQPTGAIVCLTTENEATNKNYYTEYIDKYFPIMDAIAEIGVKRGIKTSDSGILSDITYGLNEYYIQTNQPDKVEWMATVRGRKLNPNTDTYKTKVAQVNLYNDAIKKSVLTFSNLHYKEEKKTGLLTEMMNYIKLTTGKRPISNEGGFMTQNTTYMGEMLDEVKELNLPIYIVIDYSGEAGALELTDDGVKLYATY